MKYINIFILSFLLFVGILLKDSIHVSTNLLSLFATKESVTKLDIANNLGYSKEMIIAVKGFDHEAKKRVKKIAEALKKLHGVEQVEFSLVPTPALQEYYKNYYPLLAHFDHKPLTKQEVEKKLQSLYDAQLTNVFYTSINKNDPLGLFVLPQQTGNDVAHRGSMLTLGKYGYLIRVMTTIAPSQMNDARKLYDDVEALLSHYHDVIAFAPFFYTVENSAKIKADVQWIVLLSTVVLLLIYFIFLKNIKLLTQTLIALASSMIFASLICTITMENFNVLSLAFGMSLTAVSIDYLLHYYFHNFYTTSQKIDKNVFYGFLTTIIAFSILSFIPIALIAQISIFAVLSLSFAYGVFTFVFPKLSFPQYEVVEKNELITRKPLPAFSIFIVSLFLLAYSAYNFKLDVNMRHLDYQNKHLRGIEKLIKEQTTLKMSAVIVEAKSEEALISHLKELTCKLPKTFSLASFVLDKKTCQNRLSLLHHYDFKHLNQLVQTQAQAIGFKKGYFQESYMFTQNLPTCKLPNLDIFRAFSLAFFHKNGIYYTMAFVPNVVEAKTFDFVSDIDVKAMFNRSVATMYKNLELFGSFVVLVVLGLLFVSVKTKVLYALNYILFPVSLTMAVLVSMGSVNIMHLFSLIILVAIGIDYGIYMSNSEKPANTMLAIKYSLLSTFAAFGVLIFSTIVALNSIGIVITLGCGAIFILIKVMR